MRQKYYIEAAARGLVGSCPGQARYLLWAYSSTHGRRTPPAEASALVTPVVQKRRVIDLTH
ncbi:similar to RIKEN cDNA 2700062C07, isoform CRA_a [Rattus norvegicus]|uniref:Similar to RIKEN cDNA 2700062C07, isoform CRA_a n=1 Tax=Rattus norvegicus TaxID=10116 RepID=A6J2K5_RAT|nr:similar to RIKEN cDNA 2700062C07, isoform CRA_a [Rattus norvegicus]